MSEKTTKTTVTTTTTSSSSSDKTTSGTTYSHLKTPLQWTLYVLVQVFCFASGCLLLISAALRWTLVPNTGTFEYIIQWIATVIIMLFLAFFGIIIIVFTLFFPRIFQAVFGFYLSWVGRGFFFLLCGALCIGATVWDILIGIVVAGFGIFFIVLEFPCTRFINPPRGLIPAERWF